MNVFERFTITRFTLERFVHARFTQMGYMYSDETEAR